MGFLSSQSIDGTGFHDPSEMVAYMEKCSKFRFITNLLLFSFLDPVSCMKWKFSVGAKNYFACYISRMLALISGVLCAY